MYILILKIPFINEPCHEKVLFRHLEQNRHIIGPCCDKTCLRVMTKRDSKQPPQLQRLAKKLKFPRGKSRYSTTRDLQRG